jgi:hypothetical protein
MEQGLQISSLLNRTRVSSFPNKRPGGLLFQNKSKAPSTIKELGNCSSKCTADKQARKYKIISVNIHGKFGVTTNI